MGDNIEPEYGVSLRKTWGTSRPKIYSLNSKLSHELFMGRSLLYLYTDHYFEKIKPVSYDNLNLYALKLLSWSVSYLRNLGCPSHRIFFSTQKFGASVLGLPPSGAPLSLFSREPSRVGP